MIYLSQHAYTFRSNIVEPWADWDASATYQVEDANQAGGLTDLSVCKVDNYFYRTIMDNNTNNPPEDNLKTKWVKWDVANSYAMFDLRATTKSYSEPGKNLVVEFGKGTIDTLAIGYYSTIEIRIDNIGVGKTTYDGNDATKDYVIDFDAKYRPANDLTKVLDTLPDDAPIPTHTLNDKLLFCRIYDTQVEPHSVNMGVEDYYSYIYSKYSSIADYGRLFYIKPLGLDIRVTFYAQTGSQTRASCGYLIGSEATDMGQTLYGVNFSFNSYSTKTTDDFGVLTIQKRGVQDLIDFETVIPSQSVPSIKRKIKLIYDDIVAFVLDPSEDSAYENIITLGTIENVSTVLANPVSTTIAWSVHETI